jgi:hypothetical protein
MELQRSSCQDCSKGYRVVNQTHESERGHDCRTGQTGERYRCPLWLSANPHKGLDSSSPSKYFDFPVLSFGSIATVTLKRASLVKPPGVVSKKQQKGPVRQIKHTEYVV